MKRLLMFAVMAAFGLSLLGMADDAEARRFGGGMNLGKQRMQQSAPGSFSQRQAIPRKPTAANQRGAARTGMMGMLGGLAMGGLLGALLFGGAFEGINMFDIMVIAGLIGLFYLLMRNRQPMAYAGHYGQNGTPQESGDAYRFTGNEQVTGGAMLRPQIDEKRFLGAARDIYMRMQQAWDAGDIEDIRRFCTSEIADQIAEQMKPGANRTEVAALDAVISDSWIESDLEWVAVEYTAMLREQRLNESGATLEDESGEVHEIWIFRHDPKSDDPTWFLAGIQQISG